MLSFNLIDEPWIPVRDLHGGAQMVSTRRLVTEGEQWAAIDGDSPTQIAAMWRLHLAVLRAARRDSQDVPSPQTINSYLDNVRGRWDLFHPNTPFMQCPQLEQLEPQPVVLLDPATATGNNILLYDHTSAEQAKRITWDAARAARWLVTAQSYDALGLKTPAYKGAKRVAMAAPLTSTPMFLVLGVTVADTLRRNLPPRPAADDLPFWEQPMPGSEPGVREPAGFLEWMSWPARRILLHPGEGGRVHGVVMCAGWHPPKAFDVSRVELYAAWRTAKNGNRTPVRVTGAQSVWRALPALLTLAADDQTLPPYALARADRPQGQLTVLMVAQVTSQAKYVDWVYGQVVLPDTYTRASRLCQALTLAEQVAVSVRRFARTVRDDRRTSLESGAERKNAGLSSAELTFWSRLTVAYPRLCADSTLGGGVDAWWADLVRRAATEATRQVTQVSPGRDMLHVGRQHRWLTWELHKLCKEFLDPDENEDNDDDHTNHRTAVGAQSG